VPETTIACPSNIIHFERTISGDSRDNGKFADGATRNPEKDIP
jgi:hypothetical protein